MAKRCDDCSDEYKCFWIDWLGELAVKLTAEYTGKLLPNIRVIADDVDACDFTV